MLDRTHAAVRPTQAVDAHVTYALSHHHWEVAVRPFSCFGDYSSSRHGLQLDRTLSTSSFEEDSFVCKKWRDWKYVLDLRRQSKTISSPSLL